jgi:hypothetical protein
MRFRPSNSPGTWQDLQYKQARVRELSVVSLPLQVPVFRRDRDEYPSVTWT